MAQWGARTRGWRAAACALAALAMAAHAQPHLDASAAAGSAADDASGAQATAAGSSLKELVEGLGSATLEERIRASEQLQEPSRFSLREVEEVLRTATLTAEQRKRLVQVAWERFRAEPRPAMGVRTNFNQQQVILESVTRGFPAEGVLRSGDRLEKADGVRLEDFGMLRLVILARDPGDEMDLVVVRDGSVLNLKVRLGRYEALSQPLDEHTLLASFRQIRARSYYDDPAAGPVLECGLSPEAWDSVTQLDADLEADAASMEDPDTVTAVVGGEARGRPPGHDAPWGGRSDAAIVRIRGQNPALAELQGLQEVRRQLQTAIDMNHAALSNSRTPPGRRQEIIQENERLIATIRSYDLMIQQRAAQLRGR